MLPVTRECAWFVDREAAAASHPSKWAGQPPLPPACHALRRRLEGVAPGDRTAWTDGALVFIRTVSGRLRGGDVPETVTAEAAARLWAARLTGAAVEMPAPPGVDAAPATTLRGRLAAAAEAGPVGGYAPATGLPAGRPVAAVVGDIGRSLAAAHSAAGALAVRPARPAGNDALAMLDASFFRARTTGGGNAHSACDHQADRAVAGMRAAARAAAEHDAAGLTPAPRRAAPAGTADIPRAFTDAEAQLGLARKPHGVVDGGAMRRAHLAANAFLMCAACALGRCPVAQGELDIVVGPPLPVAPRRRAWISALTSRRSQPYLISELEQRYISALMADALRNGVLQRAPDDERLLTHPVFIAWKNSFAPKDPSAALARDPVEVAAHFSALAGRVVDRLDLDGLEVGDSDGSSESEGEAADSPPAPRRQRVTSRRAVPAARLALALAGEVADAKPRMVHDYRGGRLNECYARVSFLMITIGAILAAVLPGSWVASGDITAGFHTFTTHAADRWMCGFLWPESGVLGGAARMARWLFTRPTFGHSFMPFLFSTATAEAVQTLARGALAYAAAAVVFFFAYIDDIFVVAPSEALCARGLESLIAYCQAVGWVLNDKMRRPAQRGIELLGLILDTITMRLTLPDKKRYNILCLLAVATALTRGGWNLPRNFVEKLAGKLQSAAFVVRGGRSRMQSIYHAIYADRWGCDLRAALPALEWWERALQSQGTSGTRLLVVPAEAPGQFSGLTSWGDASGNVGAGLSIGRIITYWCVWDPATAARRDDIHLKEFHPVDAFLERFGWLLVGLLVCARTDNSGNFHAINRGASPDDALGTALQKALERADAEGYDLVASHVVRERNTHQDSLSKAHSRQEAAAVLGPGWFECC